MIVEPRSRIPDPLSLHCRAAIGHPKLHPHSYTPGSEFHHVPEYDTKEVRVNNVGHRSLVELELLRDIGEKKTQPTPELDAIEPRQYKPDGGSHTTCSLFSPEALAV
jgi:hypothetical protein